MTNNKNLKKMKFCYFLNNPCISTENLNVEVISLKLYIIEDVREPKYNFELYKTETLLQC